MYYLLKLDKSSDGFIQQLPAMLAVGAFEVVGQHASLEDAQTHQVKLLLADLKIRATATPTNRHYEISDERGQINDWVGMYANRETLLGLHPPVEFTAEPTVLTPERFRQIREELNLSQTEFGQYLGGSPLRTVQNWEAGERRIPVMVAEILRLKGRL